MGKSRRTGRLCRLEAEPRIVGADRLYEPQSRERAPTRRYREAQAAITGRDLADAGRRPVGLEPGEGEDGETFETAGFLSTRADPLSAPRRSQGRIRDEMSVRESRMTEVDTRIENEIGLLRAS